MSILGLGQGGLEIRRASSCPLSSSPSRPHNQWSSGVFPSAESEQDADREREQIEFATNQLKLRPDDQELHCTLAPLRLECLHATGAGNLPWFHNTASAAVPPVFYSQVTAAASDDDLSDSSSEPIPSPLPPIPAHVAQNGQFVGAG
jgi:hypothetical protein